MCVQGTKLISHRNLTTKFVWKPVYYFAENCAQKCWWIRWVLKTFTLFWTNTREFEIKTSIECVCMANNATHKSCHLQWYNWIIATNSTFRTLHILYAAKLDIIRFIRMPEAATFMNRAMLSYTCAAYSQLLLRLCAAADPCLKYKITLDSKEFLF